MILVDTGPLVALFDPRDDHHRICRDLLERNRDEMISTVSVLTEAFHLLDPSSRGAAALREFFLARGMGMFYLDDDATRRAFRLMERYSDHPMDLADASLVVAAERLRADTVWTIDRRDFATYRIRHGHGSVAFRVVP
ncbi:MAG: PIN domain-containing protein [bacterium]|nr:PIN domain-containing protein [bacterium]